MCLESEGKKGNEEMKIEWKEEKKENERKERRGKWWKDRKKKLRKRGWKRWWKARKEGKQKLKGGEKKWIRNASRKEGKQKKIRVRRGRESRGNEKVKKRWKNRKKKKMKGK